MRFIQQFFLDKGENGSHAAENVNGVYGPETLIVSFTQFSSILFR